MKHPHFCPFNPEKGCLQFILATCEMTNSVVCTMTNSHRKEGREMWEGLNEGGASVAGLNLANSFAGVELIRFALELSGLGIIGSFVLLLPGMMSHCRLYQITCWSGWVINVHPMTSYHIMCQKNSDLIRGQMSLRTECSFLEVIALTLKTSSLWLGLRFISVLGLRPRIWVLGYG